MECEASVHHLHLKNSLFKATPTQPAASVSAAQPPRPESLKPLASSMSKGQEPQASQTALPLPMGVSSCPQEYAREASEEDRRLIKERQIASHTTPEHPPLIPPTYLL